MRPILVRASAAVLALLLAACAVGVYLRLWRLYLAAAYVCMFDFSARPVGILEDREGKRRGMARRNCAARLLMGAAILCS
jgi:hypothetical protein